uniref:Uncharacterized protein n=1 Tax=Wolfiporia cocos TaxID=81056 RepID=A0A7G7YDZ6_9APHY|nr:hypothetical protein [Wolfiporia cocos]
MRQNNVFLGLADLCRGSITSKPNSSAPLQLRGIKTTSLESSYGQLRLEPQGEGVYKSFFEIKQFQDLPNSKVFYCRAFKTHHPYTDYIPNYSGASPSPTVNPLNIPLHFFIPLWWSIL